MLFWTVLSQFCAADGTLAERVALGKRRREQLGMQTEADKQDASAQSAAQQTGSLSGAAATNGPAGQVVGVGGGTVGGNGPVDALSGAAGTMMSNWGYTPGKSRWNLIEHCVSWS